MPTSEIRSTFTVTSVQNPKIKHALRLRNRRYREQHKETLVEGYRELWQAIESEHTPSTIFYCPPFFLGVNETRLLQVAQGQGSILQETSEKVFVKLSYRDRPDGLLGVSPSIGISLSEITLKSENPMILVAEAVEKPGNLGAMLRTADGAGLDAVIVCDKKTEINNPNVVRASVGTLFTMPISEASTKETITFLNRNNITIITASPKSNLPYWDIDYKRPSAIVVGSEQYGLSEEWLKVGTNARIPMLGKANSLNVSSAATLILYEALRQRHNP